MNLLNQHFNDIEKLLIAKSQIASNSGHSLHKGNARENFIKEFLKNHIGDTVKIGTGEIINCDSKINEKRNQHDIILYNSAFPKINYASDVDAFLIESVNTTIEIKSTLTKAELKKAIISASNVKRLNRNVKRYINPQKTVNPRIYCHLVAYNSTARIQTVHKWLLEIEKELGLNQTNLPNEQSKRLNFISDNLDGIFILGKGTILFDNLPLIFGLDEELYKKEPENKRIMISQPNKNVLLLFIFIAEQIKGIESDVIDLIDYCNKIMDGNKYVMWTN